jgi:hypothetical protein
LPQPEAQIPPKSFHRVMLSHAAEGLPGSGAKPANPI